MATAVEPHDTHDPHEHGADGHSDWHHKPFSAHHFENAEQQFDSGKLGMWLFLITEVLFFSGLFCAYAVYRANHPEIFVYASQYLDKYLGGMNTIVLIFSSLTMAWGVRCAQLGQRRGLITMLSITLFCAALFLGVKTFEYTEKAHKRLLWSGAFVNAQDINKSIGGGKIWYMDAFKAKDEANAAEGAEMPTPPAASDKNAGNHVFVVGEPLPPEEFESRVMASLGKAQMYLLIACILPVIIIGIGYGLKKRQVMTTGAAILMSFVGILFGIVVSIQIHHAQHAGGDHDSHAAGEHASEAEVEHEKEILAEAHPENEVVAGNIVDPMLGEETSAAQPEGMKSEHDTPKNASLFFSIYYFMTGLHAFHIICGMIAITWLLVRAVEGHFRPDYFGPVDYVGLYWHIVDLIWIYLFPLLYLIGH